MPFRLHKCLLLLSSLALTGTIPIGPLAAQSSTQQVEIVLADFSFTPHDIQLKAGQEVTLHFVNHGSGGHNFTATNFFAAASMDASTRASLGEKGKVELAKGAQMDVTLVPKAGNYKAKCGHFMHTAFGMKGSIEVG